jgi:hypothetical protein
MMHIQNKVIIIAIATLNKCSLKDLLQNIIFIDGNEVKVMFKLIFEIFASELDALLIEVCHLYGLMFIDSAFIAKIICLDMQANYFDPFCRIDNELWVSSSPNDFLRCQNQLLQQIFMIRFGGLVASYPRSFLIRKLCNCSTIHDENLFERIQNEIRKISV